MKEWIKNNKKLLIVVLIMLILLGCTGCGNEPASKPEIDKGFKSIEIEEIQTETILTETILNEEILYENVTTYWDDIK